MNVAKDSTVGADEHAGSDAGEQGPQAMNGAQAGPEPQGEPADPLAGQPVVQATQAGSIAEISLLQDPTLLQPILKQVLERAKLLKDWYDRKASERGRESRLLRIFSVILVVLGGLCPLLPESMEAEFMQPYGYLLLAIAAGFVVIDRAFGVSTSWMRYRMAHMRIDREQSLFQLSVDTSLARMNSPNSNREVLVRGVIETTREFLTKIEDLVVEETEAWLLEFATEHSKFSQKFGVGDGASGH